MATGTDAAVVRSAAQQLPQRLVELVLRRACMTGCLADADAFGVRRCEVEQRGCGETVVHHHVGPGIRYVISGELTFAEGGQETVYKAGDYYFETGNLAHTAENKSNQPLHVLVVEILPKDWTAPALILPKSQ